MMESINPSLSAPNTGEQPPKPIRARTVMLTKIKPARFRLLPVTMTMLALLLILRVNAIYFDALSVRQTLVANAEAASKEEAPKEEAPKEEAAKEGDTKDESGEAGKKEEKSGKKDEAGGSDISPSEVKALKKLDEQTRYNQVELDLLQNLSKRRDELDAREKELVIKEKALEATEKRITDRVDEMKKLQVDVSKLIETYNQHQEADVKSLVKIYENMKPANAAVIFDELEMPILLSVIDAMSERKVSPILAAMSPKRAKEVTEELAELRKVKALPPAASRVTAP